MPLTQPSRDNGYAFEGGLNLSDDLFTGVFGDIHARLLAAEAIKVTADAFIAAGTTQALAVIQQNIEPQLLAVQAQAEALTDQVEATLATDVLQRVTAVEAALAANLAALQAEAASRTAALATLRTDVDDAIAAIPEPEKPDYRDILIKLATLEGKVTGTATAVADDYVDETGIDVAASTFTKVAGGIKKIDAVTSLPLMTSNTAPAGHVASASNTYSTGFPYRAFDGEQVSNSWLANDPFPQWLQRKLPAPQAISGYVISARSPHYAPKNWTLQGSNDGSSFVVIDTQTNQTNWTSHAVGERTFTLAQVETYQYYRLNVTAVDGSVRVDVQELRLIIVEIPAADVNLVSQPFPAQASYDTARLTVVATHVDAGTITPNTDLLARVSRDDGTTWVDATLVAVTKPDGQQAFEANDIDLSGTPAGNQMRYNLKTANNANIELQAAVLQWG